MQAKRRYESVFEVDQCGNCPRYARLDKNGRCPHCQDEITAEMEDFYNDKDLERILDDHSTPLQHRLWRWSIAQRQKQQAGKGVQ